MSSAGCRRSYPREQPNGAPRPRGRRHDVRRRRRRSAVSRSTTSNGPASSTARRSGIEVEELPPHGLLRSEIEGGNPTLVYPKEDHEPASFTILNFPVDDVEATVAALRERGVEFERYEGTQMETDEQGIFRGGGPLIAWFKDPAGNVLSVIEG